VSSERSEAERVAAQVSLRFFDYQLEIGSCLRPVMTNVLKIVVVAIEHLNPYVGSRLASPLHLRVSTLREPALRCKGRNLLAARPCQPSAPVGRFVSRKVPRHKFICQFLVMIGRKHGGMSPPRIQRIELKRLLVELEYEASKVAEAVLVVGRCDRVCIPSKEVIQFHQPNRNVL